MTMSDKLEDKLLTKEMDKSTLRFEQVMDAEQEWLRTNSMGASVGALDNEGDKEWSGETWYEGWNEDKRAPCDGGDIGWVGYKGKGKGRKGNGGRTSKGIVTFVQHGATNKTYAMNGIPKGKVKGYRGEG